MSYVWDQKDGTRLPWWLGGKEPTCRCRRHREIPHAAEQLSLWATTAEPTIPLRGLEGVPGLPGAPQDETGLTRMEQDDRLEMQMQFCHHPAPTALVFSILR